MKQPRLAVFLSTLILTVLSPPVFTSEAAVSIDPTDASRAWGPCPEFMPAGCEIAVLHGDPAKPNVDILFRVPGDSIIPTHGHTSAERMILLSGELEVTYEGQETVTMREGSYAYGPAEVLHDAYCLPGDACVLFIAFEEPLDAFPVEGY